MHKKVEAKKDFSNSSLILLIASETSENIAVPKNVIWMQILLLGVSPKFINKLCNWSHFRDMVIQLFSIPTVGNCGSFELNKRFWFKNQVQ